MHSFIIQIFTFKTLIVFQKLGTIRMLVKNSTGLSNLEEKREYSPTDHVRYYGAQGPFPVPCEHDYFSFQCADVESFGLAPVSYCFYCGLCALPDYVKVISFCERHDFVCKTLNVTRCNRLK